MKIADYAIIHGFSPVYKISCTLSDILAELTEDEASVKIKLHLTRLQIQRKGFHLDCNSYIRFQNYGTTYKVVSVSFAETRPNYAICTCYKVCSLDGMSA